MEVTHTIDLSIDPIATMRLASAIRVPLRYTPASRDGSSMQIEQVTVDDLVVGRNHTLLRLLRIPYPLSPTL